MIKYILILILVTGCSTRPIVVKCECACTTPHQFKVEPGDTQLPNIMAVPPYECLECDYKGHAVSQTLLYPGPNKIYCPHCSGKLKGVKYD